MESKRLKIQNFRANDLNNDGGKQFELGKSWCEDFFGIEPSLQEKTIMLVFMPLCTDHFNLKDKVIELKLSETTNRGDRKAYANGRRGLSQIKEFFIYDLRLTSPNNLSDYFAILKTNTNQYYLYYIPKLLFDNFIKHYNSNDIYISCQRDSKSENTNLNEPLQQIFYGAPGTGKSDKIKKLTKDKSVIRTTFHPDSDYSTFVGCYKPTMEDANVRVVPVVVNNGINLDQNNGTYKEKRISYRFVMQAFLKAYLGAWKKYADSKVIIVNQQILPSTTPPQNNVNTEQNNNYEGELPLPETDTDNNNTIQQQSNNYTIEPQYLIIEEINRGNCAQIFGDLFQLLDRGENGFSTYPIDADTDLQTEIERAFLENDEYKLDNDINIEGAIKNYTSNYGKTLSDDVQHGRILLLPPNLYIWATMNTSDQSLFPIDSAFKRRWDWRYIRIKEGKDEFNQPLNYHIKFDIKGEGTFDTPWWDFLKAINKEIETATKSEDKKLGYFFCTPDNKDEIGKYPVISAETFVGKVIFYLWQDVFKDNGFKRDLFKNEDGTKISFHDFYPDDIEVSSENPEGIDLKLVKHFIEKVIKANTPATNA